MNLGGLVAPLQQIKRRVEIELLSILPSQDLGCLDCQELEVDIESRLRMEGVELKEEWQDEDFPM